MASSMLKLGHITDEDIKDVSHFHKLYYVFLA